LPDDSLQTPKQSRVWIDAQNVFLKTTTLLILEKRYKCCSNLGPYHHMPKRIRLVSSTTEDEQRKVLRHVGFLAARSDQFYAYIRIYAAAHIGVTPEWLDRAVEQARAERLEENELEREVLNDSAVQ
jgi:hypothetical protein